MPSFNLDSLTIKPSGTQVFTDLRRGKEFTTLVYRRKHEASMDTCTDFLRDVLADIGAAGLTLGDTVTLRLIPIKEAFRCHLEVSVKQAQ